MSKGSWREAQASGASPLRVLLDNAGSQVGLIGPDGGRGLARNALAAELEALGVALRQPVGNVVWKGGNKAGTSTSGGANLPVVSIVGNGLSVTTPVGTWCELTLPALRTPRLLPANLCLNCESPDWNKLLTISYYVGTAGYANFWTRTWQATTTGPSAGPECLGSGARSLYSDQSIMPVGGGAPIFSSTLVDTHKIRITPVAGESATIVLTDLRYDVDEEHPSLSIVFDDGYSTVVNNALPILLDRGLKASMGLIVDAIGSATRYCTEQQVEQWLAAGMDVFPHGPLGLGSRNNLADYPTVAEAVADMAANRARIVAKGWARRGEENFYAWPQGVLNMGGNLRDTSLIDAAIAAGFVGARSTLYNHTFNSKVVSAYPQKFNLPIIGHAKDYGGSEATNILNLLDKIDYLIDKMTSGCLLFHDVGASPTNAIDITLANFTTLMDRVANRVAQGLLQNPLVFDQVKW